MKMENENNLPAIRKNSFMKRFKEKFRTFFLMGMSLLGVVAPYVENAAAETPKDVPVVPSTTIKEVVKEDINAKYDQAFKNLHIDVSHLQVAEKTNHAELSEGHAIEDYQNKEEKPSLSSIPDDPPEEEYDKRNLQDQVLKIELAGGDDPLKLRKELKEKVNNDVKKDKVAENKTKESPLRDEI